MQSRLVVRATALALAVAAAGVLARGDARAAAGSRSPRLSALPAVMLWAWHRPEDLRGLDPHRAGVAFLAATWTLETDGPQVERRRHPLLVDESTPLLAVVRIESPVLPPPSYDPAQIRGMAQSLAELVTQSSAAGLQIDFDAKESEHGFYRALLTETRAALGDRALSMTALVSWCLGDEPLLRAPVDEVVPMLFQLGVPNAAHLKERGAAGDLRSRACFDAAGVSLAEPTPGIARGRRLYIFNSKGWTPESAKRALAEVPQWR
ncbi:MAG TPA: hypothetical protein VN700_11390 [Vicinamibacterales bacterium]|nr:hypothetical protein [Vicinamibacterales bacterium]